MNFTIMEIKAFQEWKRMYDFWVSSGRIGRLTGKPRYFDLWLQGHNPLGLELTKGTPTHLVPPDWTSDAIPVPLPAEDFIQPPLL